MPVRHPRRYAAFAHLTRPAEGRSELWRLGLGILLAGAVTFGLTRAFFAIASLLLPDDAYWTLLDDIQSAEGPKGLLILLALIGALGIGAVVAAEIVHRRSGATLIGPLPLALRQFMRVTGAVSLLTIVVALLPPWTLHRDLEPGLPVGLWITLLPVTLAALLIQTGSEELFFRGYLQSQIAARLQHPAFWLVIPSAVFAAAHYAPAIYGDNASYVALWAGLFGLAAADLTARAGTLGPAIALHFVNNVFAIAVTSMQGEMSGLALTRLPFGADDAEAVRAFLPLDLAMMGLGWLAARIAIRA